jgi:phosphohistidine phosphatase
MGDNAMKTLSKAAKKYDYVLVLMRHAKAESIEDVDTGDDAARELTDKGYKQAKHMAKVLVEAKLNPDLLVSSGVARARQTTETMLKVFGDHPKVHYRQSIYESGRKAIWDEIVGTKSKVKRMLVVGHEPDISMVCGQIASKESDTGLLALLRVGVGNASICVLGFNKPFKAWEGHCADLLGVFGPKDF